MYKLTVGGVPYFGYTSRNPNQRLKEHLDTAYAQKWRHNSKLYPALVEAEYEYEFEVIFKTDNEVEALFREIWEIEKAFVSLNNSSGGEGSTVNVKVKKYKNGSVHYKIVPRKKGQKQKSKPRKRKVRR